MISIFDCSNSAERPNHRINSGGPVENDIMADLKKYVPKNFEFVDHPDRADVIITNDIFPQYILDLYKNRIKVKRMDGVFGRNILKKEMSH